ncbi:MAG: DUF7710 domain-containing protein [Micromonosporaceae bacterium]
MTSSHALLQRRRIRTTCLGGAGRVSPRWPSDPPRVTLVQRQDEPGTVWVFHGDGARFASGVFTSEDEGLAWAALHQVTGVLSEYRVGAGCYDAAVQEGRFRPNKPHHGTADHIAAFSPGLRHTHLRDGTPA